jgi:hypothetical protein
MTGFRTWTVHSEKGLTGNFRMIRIDGALVTQVEVEIEKVRTMEERELYRTFRAATPADHARAQHGHLQGVAS